MNVKKKHPHSDRGRQSTQVCHHPPQHTLGKSHNSLAAIFPIKHFQTPSLFHLDFKDGMTPSGPKVDMIKQPLRKTRESIQADQLPPLMHQFARTLVLNVSFPMQQHVLSMLPGFQALSSSHGAGAPPGASIQEGGFTPAAYYTHRG